MGIYLDRYGGVSKLGVPVRTIVFAGLYWGPLFRETTICRYALYTYIYIYIYISLYACIVTSLVESTDVLCSTYLRHVGLARKWLIKLVGSRSPELQ